MKKMLMIITLMVFIGVSAASAQTYHVVHEDLYMAPSGTPNPYYHYGYNDTTSTFKASFYNYPSSNPDDIIGVSVYVIGVKGSMDSNDQTYLGEDEFELNQASVSSIDPTGYDYILAIYTLEYAGYSEWHFVYYQYY